MMDFSLSILMASVVSGAAPLVFATLGETFSERVGIINLSLDGTILLSAMVSFAVAYETGNLAWGFLAGGVVGALIAALIAFTSLFWGISQVAVGFVLTLMCKDLAYFLGNPYTRIQGPQLSHLPVPFLEKIPVIGNIFFQHNIMVYLSYACIMVTWFYFYRTQWGLKLRCIGENPRAAYTRGFSVKKIQFGYATLGGFLVGIAGALYSLSVKPGWGRPQGAEGMGWIALAIVIFGGWDPLKVAFGAYFFGFLQIMGIVFQSWWPSIPAQVFQVAPFPLMIFMLVLIHLSRGQRMSQFLEAHPVFRPIIRFLQVNPPASLGKTD